MSRRRMLWQLYPSYLLITQRYQGPRPFHKIRGCDLPDSSGPTKNIKALDSARIEAERLCGKLPKLPFLVTDNGPSFIARRFNNHLKDRFRQVRIRYRKPTQLGLLERFHKTLKEEEVYWRLYDHPEHCRSCLAEFRDRYNDRRPHWALIPFEGGDPLTPQEVYFTGRKTQIPRWQAGAKAARKKLDQMMTEAA